MRICPSCQQENRDLARFCVLCGKPLNSEALTVVLPATTEPTFLSPAMGGGEEAPLPVHDVQPQVEAAPAVVRAAGIEDASQPAHVVRMQIEMEQAAEVASATCAEPDAPETTQSARGALPAGVTIAGRFVITRLMSSEEDSWIYEATDSLRCATCGAENASRDQFCGTCGVQWQGGACVHLQENKIMADDPETIVFEGYGYKLLAPVAELAVLPVCSTGWRFQVGQASDNGLLRELDEDSVFSLVMSGIYQSQIETTVGLFIVADGMGGQAGGEVASKLAVQTVAQRILQRVLWPLLQGENFLQESLGDRVVEAVQAANAEVYSLRHAQGNDMGTTLTMALAVNEQVLIANVGDSRTYVWSQDGLQQLTEDHSLIALLIANGEEPPEAIYTHPQRNLITRNLGDRPTIEVDVFSLELEGGFRLLLCCDGVWEMIRNEGIEDALLQETDPQRVADHIVQACNAAGGEDNISVIVVAVEQAQEANK